LRLDASGWRFRLRCLTLRFAAYARALKRRFRWRLLRSPLRHTVAWIILGGSGLGRRWCRWRRGCGVRRICRCERCRGRCRRHGHWRRSYRWGRRNGPAGRQLIITVPGISAVSHEALCEFLTVDCAGRAIGRRRNGTEIWIGLLGAGGQILLVAIAALVVVLVRARGTAIPLERIGKIGHPRTPGKSAGCQDNKRQGRPSGNSF
jgi:hypothetical protein